MSRIGLYGSLALSMMVILLGIWACGSDEDDDGIDDQVDCTLDEDCPTGNTCSPDGFCEACTPCETRSDCPSGYSCLTERGCCKEVECSIDNDCDDPKYCIDLICRQKSCTESADCTRFDHTCYQGYCISRECNAHEDCESNLCDLTNYVCLSCVVDADCPSSGLICDDGDCIPSSVVDGDGTGEKLGCAAFKEGCMYESMTCFDKLNPAESFSSCSYIKDEDEIIGYEFLFSDGSTWRWYTDPSTSYEALSPQGYCYRIVPDMINGVMIYYDNSGNTLGSYSVDLLTETVTVYCPDGSTEWYDRQRLIEEDCEGYQSAGIYSPPAPGLEACQ